MHIKDYIRCIKDEIGHTMKYYSMAKCSKENEDSESAQYLMKMASDRLAHINTLFKLLDNCVEKKASSDKYNGVYKEIYNESIDILRDEYKNIENEIKHMI